MHLVVCPHCWRQLRFRSSAGLVAAARMTCRYCGTTFAAKVLEWQDDMPMPTAHDVYPHLSASSTFSAEEIPQIAEISQFSETIDFRLQGQPQAESEPEIAAWAAGVDMNEGVEITAQPRIGLRRQEHEVSAEDADDKYRMTAEVARQQPPAEPENDCKSQFVEVSLPQADETEAEVCHETVKISEDIVDKDVIEFPSFVSLPEPQSQPQGGHEAIIETASSSECLEAEKFDVAADAFQTAALIIEEEELLARVEANDGQIKKFNHRVYICAVLAAIALAIIVGLIWMIFLSGGPGGSKDAVSDLNASIRQDIEIKFDDSPKVGLAPVEENSMAEMVTISQSAETSPAVAVASVSTPAVSAASHKVPAETFTPAELDSSRVEITIVNGEGKILRLASRSYRKFVSGGEIVFGATEIEGPSAVVAKKASAEPVDPIAMKILNMSRWGGLLGSSAEFVSPAGPVYVWCEFYGNDGLRAGAARGVLDRASLSLKPGGTSVCRMFFQPGLSNSTAVPDEVLFETLSGQGGLAMAASGEVAIVGMPVLFK